MAVCRRVREYLLLNNLHQLKPLGRFVPFEHALLTELRKVLGHTSSAHALQKFRSWSDDGESPARKQDAVQYSLKQILFEQLHLEFVLF